MNPVLLCEECEEEKEIITDNIYTAYRVILQPAVSELEIKQAVDKRLASKNTHSINFHQADSLSNNITDLYKVFYCPSESAYKEFYELRENLDIHYDTTTEKGRALEVLILKIFGSIKNVCATNAIKTLTNQFDVTALCGVNTTYPSVFNYLTPYFIIECKNEKKKPDNTYTNKLESILETNAAQFGIVFGRKDATEPCFQISRDYYLVHKNSAVQKIIITCSDKDLEYIITKRVNLLLYLDFKIFQITTGSLNSTFESFITAHPDTK